MASTTGKHIALWLDRTSEPGEARWIVSREDGDTTTTLRVFGEDDRDAALDAAAAVAAQEGLRLVQESRGA